MPSLHHLVRRITLASLAAIVYQMEKITLACVPRVEEDPTASVSPKTMLPLLGITALVCSFVFSKSRFQGPVFRSDKIVVIVTLLQTKIITFGGAKTSTIFTSDYFMSENVKVERPYLRATTALKSEPFLFQSYFYINLL